ncbi:MAG: WbqC family protein [Melioribacteraceae bacterium]|nr:MAG: WbqC family protein [Melioribacteraceae bacterium]
MKKIAIMQPYIFPYIGYFQLINAVDKFVLYDDVNFINKGWINRNRILLNGKDYLFTIPCEKASQNKLINEVEVKQEEKAVEKFLKTIKSSYNKAQFFTNVYEIIEKVFQFDKMLISEFAYKSIYSVMNYLGIEKEIVFSSKEYSNRELKKADRLIDICRQENCTNYINSIGGKDLYDKKYFEQNGISISFLKTENIEYNQFGNPFVPNLSIIDVLMFNDKNTVMKFLNQYTLI